MIDLALRKNCFFCLPTALLIWAGMVSIAPNVSAITINGFTDGFAPNQWTTTKSPANLDAEVTQDANILTLEWAPAETGGLEDNYIERTIVAPSNPGNNIWTLTFTWIFTSFGGLGSQQAGYILGTNYTNLATANESFDEDGFPISQTGPHIVYVNPGDTFGFRFQALANSSAQAYFDITNFEATAVPFESDAWPVIIASGLFGVGIWTKRKFSQKLSIQETDNDSKS